MSTIRTRRAIAEEPPGPTNPFLGTLSLAEAAELIPGKRAASTLWGWCRIGVVRGPSTIRLRYVRCGRQLRVRAADLLAFCETVAAAERELDRARDERRSRAS